MADKDESATRGNDWEVVSLTASAYAAAPGPKQVVDLKDDDKEVTRYQAETSHPLYMSRHFVFPPTELENIATDPSELTEASKKIDFGFSVEQETGSCVLCTMQRAIGGSQHVYEQNEPVVEPTEPVTPSDVSSDVKDEKHQVADVPPCEAWWKRSATSLISQAKETNTVWSIFIAAAVMGIVILGQHWQQERWQILQLKWESSIANEKAGRLMGPITRLKQAFVGGQRRDSFIRVNSQNDR
ncbi:ATG8-interacting protein 2 [Cardamine amara subsp. amara]|uniref:ATG8-interacting protein 2 n=1 Tax=Cardamine amara subsp. amara TaxID=228776 RepID=A0ABD1BFQ7_CARAN